jgi:hypothetical protein
MPTPQQSAQPRQARGALLIARSSHSSRSIVLRTTVLALLAGIGMLAFVVSPVVEHTAPYQWSAAANGVRAALPLDPYYPAELTVELPCATAEGPAQTVLSTYPLTSADPAGLRIGSDGRGMVIIRDGVPVATGVRPPAGCGTLAVHFTAAATTISADQTIFATYGGDRRPRVSGFFANPQAQAGLRARVVADTQFDTSSSLIKWIIGALSILFLVLALDGVRGAPAAGEAIEQRSGMSDDPARHGDSASSTPRPASEEPAVGHGGVSAARPG